jgi:ABC-type multidrug transport system permease subunit
MIDHQNGIYIKYMLINANYGDLFFSILAFAILGASIGILMSTLLNSIVSIQIVGATLVLFSVFLGGGGIPLQYIAMYSQNQDTHQFKPFSI